MNQYRCKYHKSTRYSIIGSYVIYHADYNAILKCKKCKKLDNIKLYRDNLKREKKLLRMKEELWDCYLYHEFMKGIKNPNLIEIEYPPKIVFQLMRTTLKLQLLIKNIKKNNRDLKGNKQNVKI